MVYFRSSESEANRSVNSPFGQNYMATTDPILAAHASNAAPTAAAVHGSGQKDSAAPHAHDSEHSVSAAVAVEGTVHDGMGNGVPQ
jgi:hypothetical protein